MSKYGSDIKIVIKFNLKKFNLISNYILIKSNEYKL